MIWIGNVIQEATFNFTWVDRNRLTSRITGALYSIIYDKLLRIGVINYHDHDEGSIINYLQNDVDKFKEATSSIKMFIVSILNLFLCIFMGVFFFHYIFAAVFFGIVALSGVAMIIIQKWTTNENRWARAMDKRLNVLKNVFKKFEIY